MYVCARVESSNFLGCHVRASVNFANITEHRAPISQLNVRLYVYIYISVLCASKHRIFCTFTGEQTEYELANSTETVDSRGYSRPLAQFSISLRPVCPFVFNFAMMLATLITPVFLHPRSEFNGASFLFRNVQ